jgi:hypothetical protein
MYPPIQDPDTGKSHLDPRNVNNRFDWTFREHINGANVHVVNDNNLKPHTPVDIQEITDLLDRFVRPTTAIREKRGPMTLGQLRANIQEFYRFMGILYKYVPSLQNDPKFGEAYAEIQRLGSGKRSGLFVFALYRRIGEFLTEQSVKLNEAKQKYAALDSVRYWGGTRRRQRQRRPQRKARKTSRKTRRRNSL